MRLIALLAALVTGLCVYQLLKEISKPAEIPETSVLVAVKNIKTDETITEDMVAVQAVPVEAVHPDALKSPDDAVGYIVTGDIYAGEQILEDRLVELGEIKEDSNLLAYRVAEGMRAVAVEVDQVTGVANGIVPGNHVDVIMNYTYEIYEKMIGSKDEVEYEKISVPASRIILQDIEVLAVGAEKGKNVPDDYEYDTVTLLADPQQAAAISFAEYIGQVRLIARSAIDEEKTETIEVDLDTIQGINRK